MAEGMDYSSGAEDYSSGAEDTSHNNVEMEFQLLEHKAERSSRKKASWEDCRSGGNSMWPFQKDIKYIFVQQ